MKQGQKNEESGQEESKTATIPTTAFSNFLKSKSTQEHKTLQFQLESSNQYKRVSKKAKLCSIDVTKRKITEIMKLRGSKPIIKKPKKQRKTLKEMIENMTEIPKPLKIFKEELKFGNSGNSPPQYVELEVKSDSNEKRSRVLERDGKKRIQEKVIRKKLMEKKHERKERGKRRNSFL